MVARLRITSAGSVGSVGRVGATFVVSLVASLASLTVGMASLSAPAEARIKCVNGFQIVKGQRLATPYCQDALVARVARQYGSRVSAKAIRQNPNLKRNVCRLIGQDIRVKHICETALPSSNRGGI